MIELKAGPAASSTLFIKSMWSRCSASGTAVVVAFFEQAALMRSQCTVETHGVDGRLCGYVRSRGDRLGILESDGVERAIARPSRCARSTRAAVLVRLIVDLPLRWAPYGCRDGDSRETGCR